MSCVNHPLGFVSSSSSDHWMRQVWSLETFEKVYTVHAHAESVLSLCLSEDKQFLFSSGVDSVVNVQPLSSSLFLTLKSRRFGLPKTYHNCSAFTHIMTSVTFSVLLILRV